MSNIMNLLRLDKSMLKPYYRYLLIVFFGPAVMIFSYRAVIPGIIFSAVMVAMICSYTFSVAEKNDLNRLYGLLPVDRKDIVTGRYLFTALLGVAAIAVSLLLNAVILTFLKAQFTFDEMQVGIASAIILYFVLTAVQLPGFFKFGAIKGKFFSFLPLIGLFFIGFIIDAIKADDASSGLVKAIRYSPHGLLAFAVLLAVLLYAISIGISQKIYCKMEL